MDANTQKYAIKNSKKELHNIHYFFQDLKKKINKGHKEFDVVIRINVLHNLTINQISESLEEIERKYQNINLFVLESYENENIHIQSSMLGSDCRNAT